MFTLVALAAGTVCWGFPLAGFFPGDLHEKFHLGDYSYP